MKRNYFMQCLYAGLAMVFLFYSTPSFAFLLDGDDYYCEYLNVRIANWTEEPCLLADSELVSGHAMLPPPFIIGAHNVANFQLKQIWSSKVITTYSCGDKTITLSSAQTTCQVSGGYVKAEIVSSDPGIMAKHTSRDSSSFWDTPGQLDWLITNR